MSKSPETYALEIAHKNIFPVEDYKGCKTKILHECINGHQWEAYPTNVLVGKGCPQCNGHYKKDDYDGGRYKLLETYKDRNTPILHECICGFQWKIRPSHVLTGHGCPRCANWGFDKSKAAVLYYVKLTKDTEVYYKVGVTNKTVKERFKGEKVCVDIIYTETFDTGEEALIKEKELLDRNQRISVRGFLKSGYTELFSGPLENFNGRTEE